MVVVRSVLTGLTLRALCTGPSKYMCAHCFMVVTMHKQLSCTSSGNRWLFFTRTSLLINHRSNVSSQREPGLQPELIGHQWLNVGYGPELFDTAEVCLDICPAVPSALLHDVVLEAPEPAAVCVVN